jgi:Short repeat of unknown function (DUF308)
MVRTVQSVAKTTWWLVLLRRIFMVLFGIIALVSPGIALLTLVWVFGVYAILDGGRRRRPGHSDRRPCSSTGCYPTDSPTVSCAP